MTVGDPSIPLARAVAEIEQHVADAGWDQGPRLFALAPTSDLLLREPALADQLRLEGDGPAPGQLTPIEQELPERQLEDVLATISGRAQSSDAPWHSSGSSFHPTPRKAHPHP